MEKRLLNRFVDVQVLFLKKFDFSHLKSTSVTYMLGYMSVNLVSMCRLEFGTVFCKLRRTDFCNNNNSDRFLYLLYLVVIKVVCKSLIL